MADRAVRENHKGTPTGSFGEKALLTSRFGKSEHFQGRFLPSKTRFFGEIVQNARKIFFNAEKLVTLTIDFF